MTQLHKRAMTFWPTKQAEMFIESLPPGSRSDTINKAVLKMAESKRLEQVAKDPKTYKSIDQAISKANLEILEMRNRIKVLEWAIMKHARSRHGRGQAWSYDYELYESISREFADEQFPGRQAFLDSEARRNVRHVSAQTD